MKNSVGGSKFGEIASKMKVKPTKADLESWNYLALPTYTTSLKIKNYIKLGLFGYDLS